MTDILIIEDNTEIAELLSDFIRKAGYSCVYMNSGEAGLAYLESHEAGMVLLDIMLPGIDGFAVCNEIYINKNLPIIILSAKTEKEDKLNGLLLGADDYIEKPYDVDLLIAKINALYRRHYRADADCQFSAGSLKINIESRCVELEGQPINLNVKEFDLLLLLVQNKGKVLRKDFIFNKVWGVDSFSEPSTLAVHIKWLREKIEKDPKNPKRIVTVWGVGYKFEEAYE